MGIVALHVDFSLAFHSASPYELDDWINEWDVITDTGSNGHPRRLFTEFTRKPRCVCAADFAILALLHVDDGTQRTKVYLGEFDRHTTQSPKRIADDKAPGCAELARRGWHRKFWPDGAVTEDAFKVMVITTGSATWRDNLRRAFAKTARPDLYVFACREHLTPETMLTDPVFFPASDGEGKPLLRLTQREAAHA